MNIDPDPPKITIEPFRDPGNNNYIFNNRIFNRGDGVLIDVLEIIPDGNSIDQDTLRQLMICDCKKDVIEVPAQHQLDDVQFNYFITKLREEFPQYGTYISEIASESRTSHNVLIDLKQSIRSSRANNLSEFCFERYRQKHYCDIVSGCNEAGLSIKSISLHKDDALVLDIGANHVDAGPGNGDVPFCPIGYTLVFNHAAMVILGFSMVREYKITTIGIGHYLYEVRIARDDDPNNDIHYVFSNLYNIDEMTMDNPQKNEAIKAAAAGEGDYIVLSLLKKALGDPMQIHSFYFVYKLLPKLEVSFYDFLKFKIPQERKTFFADAIATIIGSKELSRGLSDSELPSNPTELRDNILHQIESDYNAIDLLMNKHFSNVIDKNLDENDRSNASILNNYLKGRCTIATNDWPAFYRALVLQTPSIHTPGGTDKDGAKMGLIYQPETNKLILIQGLVAANFKKLEENHLHLKNILATIRYDKKVKVFARMNGTGRREGEIILKLLTTRSYRASRTLQTGETVEVTEAVINGIDAMMDYVNEIKDFLVMFIIANYNQAENQNNEQMKDELYKLTAYMCLQLLKNYSFPQVFSVHKKSTGRGIVGYILNTSVQFMNKIRERTFDPLLNGYTVDPFLSGEYVHLKHNLTQITNLSNSHLKNQVLITLEPLFNEFFEEVPNALSQNQAAAMGQSGGAAFFLKGQYIPDTVSRYLKRPSKIQSLSHEIQIETNELEIIHNIFVHFSKINLCLLYNMKDLDFSDDDIVRFLVQDEYVHTVIQLEDDAELHNMRRILYPEKYPPDWFETREINRLNKAYDTTKKSLANAGSEHILVKTGKKLQDVDIISGLMEKGDFTLEQYEISNFQKYTYDELLRKDYTSEKYNGKVATELKTLIEHNTFLAETETIDVVNGILKLRRGNRNIEKPRRTVKKKKTPGEFTKERVEQNITERPEKKRRARARTRTGTEISGTFGPPTAWTPSIGPRTHFRGAQEGGAIKKLRKTRKSKPKRNKTKNRKKKSKSKRKTKK